MKMRILAVATVALLSPDAAQDAMAQSRRSVMDDFRGGYWATKSVCVHRRGGNCVSWAHRKVPVYPNMRPHSRKVGGRTSQK
jgi:hypothetical protein